VINGIKVLFTDGRKVEAYIFIAGQDTEESVVELTCKLAENGWVPVKGQSVPMVYDPRRGWVRRETEPSLRQKLGLRPAWKIA